MATPPCKISPFMGHNDPEIGIEKMDDYFQNSPLV
jgi:hypothetical protein